MGKKVLKMVNCCHKDVTNVCSQYSEKGRNRNSWWYLHGELESASSTENPYDKAIMLNLDEFPEYTKEMLNWHEIRNGVSREPDPQFFQDVHINGIVDVEVYGVDEPCVGYFWTNDRGTCTNIDKDGNTIEFEMWEQRGYVCLKSDKASCEEAREAYCERKTCL